MAGPAESTNSRVEGCDDAKDCAKVSHSLSKYMTDKGTGNRRLLPSAKGLLGRPWFEMYKQAFLHSSGSASLHHF